MWTQASSSDLTSVGEQRNNSVCYNAIKYVYN